MRLCLIALATACGSPDAIDIRYDAPAGPQLVYRGQIFDGTLGSPTLSTRNGIDGRGAALLFHVFDLSPAPATQTFTVTAPGWDIKLLAATSSTSLFGAFAPDTQYVDVTARSDSPTASTNLDIFEFVGTTPTLVFSSATLAECACGGWCATTLVTAADDSVVWAAIAPGEMTMPGPGFTDAFEVGRRSEYRYTHDRAGTVVPVSMSTGSQNATLCAMVAVSIAPR